MFEGDYCPNCDNYIKQLEAENKRLQQSLDEYDKTISDILYVLDARIE